MMPRRSVLTGPLILLAVIAILALALSGVGARLGDDGRALGSAAVSDQRAAAAAVED